MKLQQYLLVIAILAVFGAVFSFLWVQTGLPVKQAYDPWDAGLQFFPSLFALWIPVIYLFFTGVWSSLEWYTKNEEEQWRPFRRLDVYSYGILAGFLLWQLSWKTLGMPLFWLRCAVLLLLLTKSLILFRALYRVPQLIQTRLLIPISLGIYMLSYPFLHVSFASSLTDVMQQAYLVQFGIIFIKSLALSVMMREMFLLSTTLTTSKQGALFAWMVVSFTFPVMGFPPISYILAGLLFGFVLRLQLSRINTRELIVGLLEPASIAIVIKFVILLLILATAGLIYWSNVKPGFEVNRARMFQAALSTILDGQVGLLIYAPLYWLALFGITYVLFFRIGNGILLLVVGMVLYAGYHLAVYGILGQVVRQNDIVPFLPFLGVFIAVAHHRFGTIPVFHGCARLLTASTVVMTVLLLLFHADFTSVSTTVAEIQRSLMLALKRDISAVFPAMVFRPYSLSLLIWVGGFSLMAFYCAQLRANSANQPSKKIHPAVVTRVHIEQMTLYPFLLGTVLFCGMLLFAFSNRYVSFPVSEPISLSSQHPKQQLSLREYQSSTEPSKGMLLVSYLTSSTSIPHAAPLASLSVHEQKDSFEIFTLKAGKDTAELILDQHSIREQVQHGRAAIYHSWASVRDEGSTFDAHEYYTRLMFKKPLHVQKINMKLLQSKDYEFPDNFEFHIKDILLLE